MDMILIILTGLTIFLLLYSLLLWIFNSKQEVDRRIKKMVTELDEEQKEQLKEKRRQQVLQFNQVARRMGTKFTTKEKLKGISDHLIAAGLRIRPEEYIVFRIIFTILTGLILNLVSGSILITIMGTVFGWIIPNIWVKQRISKRLDKFNQQLPDALNTMVSSLRAGFSFPQAIQTAAQEMDSPISEELDTVLREMQWGRTLEEALNNLKRRVPSYDLDLMVEAVIIQKQVGGNLASIITTIVNTIRDRNRIQRQIKTLTAQGKLSGYVIALLPLVLGIIIYLIDSQYILTLFQTTLGLAMVAGAVVSGVIGFLLIKKIITIEV